jgi:glycosyltransferase involved in cell wall biosynthesis
MYRIVFLGGEDVSARIDISKELIKQKCHIEIIGTESAENFIDSGIKYQQFDLNREFDVIGDFKSLFQIRKILKNYSKNTVVHAFDTKLTILLPIASIGLKNIKVVRTINGMGRIFTSSNIKNKILKFIYKFIQRSLKKNVEYTIFQNTDNYNYFIKNNLVNKEASSVIMSSGINLLNYSKIINEVDKNKLRIELNINDKQPTFILISRLIKQKGVLNYLEAAQKCFDNGFKFNFLLVGQIDSNNDAVPFEQINKYKHCVSYLGKQTNIKELLSISDIFVLPTYYGEGVPRVLLEASAMSLALLTTNMPGCNDVLLDGINGLYINVNDSDDLYIKMKYLSENKDILSRFKINAFKHVNNFSLDKISSECLKIYKNVYNKK